MKNKRTGYSLLLLIFITISWSVNGQDIHFSQYYLSPLTLNPAKTGFFDGDYRGAANYRNQWRSIGNSTPFVTTSLSFDLNLKSFGLQPKQIKDGVASAGLMFFSDKTGRAALKNQSVLLSVAYRTFIDLSKKHEVSFGFQGGIVNRSMGFDLIWNNQFNGDKFDQSQSAKEPFGGDKITFSDFNLGLFWKFYMNPKLELNGGFSLFHLTQPTESFLGAVDNKINLRQSLHAGAEYRINSKISLHPNLLFMNQSKAQELNFGSSISYHMGAAKKTDVMLYGGLWNRLSLRNTIIDAMFPTIGAKYKNIQVGISYDINISSLSRVSNLKGGPELAIIYIGHIAKPMPVKPVLPCTRF